MDSRQNVNEQEDQKTVLAQHSQDQNLESNSQPRGPQKNSAATGKPVLAIKYVAAQPYFWQQKKLGSRDKPLTKGDHAKMFLTQEEMAGVYQRQDANRVQVVAVRE